MINDKYLLLGLIIGTLITYLFIPSPNILYKDNLNTNVVDFSQQSNCYSVNTQEIKCPKN